MIPVTVWVPLGTIPSAFAPKLYGSFPKLGVPFGGPYNRDYSILGSKLGSPYFGKLPYKPSTLNPEPSCQEFPPSTPSKSRPLSREHCHPPKKVSFQPLNYLKGGGGHEGIISGSIIEVSKGVTGLDATLNPKL